MKKNNRKGFTLAELLIVVAIIAVLTAIAIPVFSGQLEKARKATDEANIRAAYAEAATDYLEDDDFDNATITAGGMTCSASIDGGEIVITVASGAGQKSNEYAKGATYKSGVFTPAT